MQWIQKNEENVAPAEFERCRQKVALSKDDLVSIRHVCMCCKERSFLKSQALEHKLRKL